MTVAVFSLLIFFLLVLPCWSADEVSAEFLINSSRMNRSALVLGRVEKLVRPSEFTFADPPN